MATKATGTFHNTGWNEETYQKLDGKAKLTRATIEQDLSGGIAGKANWVSLMCYRTDGTAAYNGLMRVVGKIGKRTGSFVAETTGTFDGTKARTKWTVVPDSGTKGLRGLRGKGTSVAAHGPDGTFSLTYELD
jgi:hypothetical protein